MWFKYTPPHMPPKRSDYIDIDSLQQELLAYRDMVSKVNSRCDELEGENERLKEQLNAIDFKKYERLIHEDNLFQEFLKMHSIAPPSES